MQYLTKHLPNLAAESALLRQLLTLAKNTTSNGSMITRKRIKKFKKLVAEITENQRFT